MEKGTIAVAGDGHPIKVVRRNLSDDVKNKQNCLMKISGDWYDVADFMDQHPGGDILKEFVGKDITVMYRLWHPTYVFNNPDKFVKKVPSHKIKFLDCPSGTPTPSLAPTTMGSDSDEDGSENSFVHGTQYVLEQKPPAMNLADKQYLDIYTSAEKRGFFKGTQGYLNERFAMILAYFCGAVFCFHYCSSFYMHAIGAFCLFQVWYQNAGLMHDTCHNQYYNGNIKKNERLMFLSANIGLGVSSSFWKWEHVEHHTFTNSFDGELGNMDPQATEDVWIQDAQLVDYREQNWFNWVVLRIQKYVFPLAIIFFSRIGIVIDSFVTETRAYEFVGLAVHLSWVCWLLSPMYHQFGLLYAFFCYYIAAVFFCLLAFQLQSNHMDKPWVQKLEEFDTNGRPMSHIHRHIRACTNIAVPRWLDAYWGGLHFHMEHHCFPRMARQHYRTFAPEWRKFCTDHGYEYNLQSFSETMSNVMSKLHEVRNIRDIFDLDKHDHEHEKRH